MDAMSVVHASRWKWQKKAASEYTVVLCCKPLSVYDGPCMPVIILCVGQAIAQTMVVAMDHHRLLAADIEGLPHPDTEAGDFLLCVSTMCVTRMCI